MSDQIVIAIDGPAASGKSSVAKVVSRRLGLIYVNTGAMYRAVTWHVLENGIPVTDIAQVASFLEASKITCGVENLESTILIDGIDPTPYLVDQAVNENVSQVATVADVRRLLVDLQRTYAVENDVVMEGRDIGSVVFPQTRYKFYIDASPEVRAMRRARQGLNDAIQARDKVDSSRRTSPLIIAEDAHVVDSSHLTIDGVAGEIIGRLKLAGLTIEDGPSTIRR